MIYTTITTPQKAAARPRRASGRTREERAGALRVQAAKHRVVPDRIRAAQERQRDAPLAVLRARRDRRVHLAECGLRLDPLQG